MKVAIIGPGRVGTLLALALPRAGHRIVAVTGGSPASQEAFAGRVAGVRRTTLSQAAEHADLLVVSTPDAEVAGVVRDLAAADVLREHHRVVHLAGSLGLDVLRPAALAGARVAAVHPAQTVPADAEPDALVGAAWAVTAGAEDREWANDLVVDLGGDPHDLRDEDRVLYHAALVLGSNAVAAAASAARQLLLAASIDDPAAFLSALAHRSVDNVLADGAAAITGPVVRGDVGTVRRHLASLDGDAPDLAAAYRHLQRAVVQQVALQLDDDVRAALLAALDEA